MYAYTYTYYIHASIHTSVIRHISILNYTDIHMCGFLMEPMQSAYQANHSTESTLVHVKADNHASMDNQDVVCLVLLDLSATFDMVDHSILLYRLESVFGITSMTLDWIQS